MYAVESKYIREQLDFRIKSLRAIGSDEIAAMLEYDIAKIMQHENFVLVNDNESIFAERVKFARRDTNG